MANPSIDTALLPGNVALRSQDWSDFTLPVLVNRNFTIIGPAQSPVTLDMGFVRGKARLGNGTTLTFRSVVLVNARSGSINQVPGLDLLLPLPPGEVAIIKCDQIGVVFPACFPIETVLQVTRVITTSRPSFIPGVNNCTQPQPQNPNCSNSSTSLMDRCWIQTLYCPDAAFYGADPAAGGNPVPNGYVVHQTQTYALCSSLVSEECIAKYTALGCILYTFSLLNGTSASQSDPHGSDGRGHSRRRALAIGLGCGLGGLLLCVALGTIGLRARPLLSRWQRRMARPPKAPSASRAGDGTQDGSDDGVGRAAAGSDGLIGDSPVSGGLQRGDNMCRPPAMEPASIRCGSSTAGAPADSARSHGGRLPVATTAQRPQGPATIEEEMRQPEPIATISAADTAADGFGPGHKAAAYPASATVISLLTPQRQGLQLNARVVVMPSALGATSTEDSSGGSCHAQGVSPVAGSGADGGNGQHHVPIIPAAEEVLSHTDTVTLLPTVLGKGACGRVYEGLYRGQKVAVKVMLSEEAGGEGAFGGLANAPAGAPVKQLPQPTQPQAEPAPVPAAEPTQVVLPTISSEALGSWPSTAAPWHTAIDASLGGFGTALGQSGKDDGDGAAAASAASETPGLASVGSGAVAPGTAAAEVQEPQATAEPENLQASADDCQKAVGQQEAIGAVATSVTEADALRHQLQLFASEVSVLGRCDHPNVVRLLAACLTPPRLCLVMERCETNLEKMIYGERRSMDGGDMGQERGGVEGARGMGGGLIPLPKLLHIGIQICQGLEYLHPTIVHRDLKPANVLINGAETDRPVAKLADFGLSRIRAMTQPTAHPEAGTPAYNAPECYDLTTFSITHHADMYSLGVLLWAMLTGQQPWKGYNIVAVAYKVVILRERPPLHHLSSARCPPKLRRLIQQCWNADPRRRPAAAEAVKELRLILESLVSPTADGANAVSAALESLRASFRTGTPSGNEGGGPRDTAIASGPGADAAVESPRAAAGSPSTLQAHLTAAARRNTAVSHDGGDNGAAASGRGGGAPSRPGSSDDRSDAGGSFRGGDVVLPFRLPSMGAGNLIDGASSGGYGPRQTQQRRRDSLNGSPPTNGPPANAIHRSASLASSPALSEGGLAQQLEGVELELG